MLSAQAHGRTLTEQEATEHHGVEDVTQCESERKARRTASAVQRAQRAGAREARVDLDGETT
jgi:hypothetical protein